MVNTYNEFLSFLELEDKENAVNLILSLLEEKKIDIVTLYTEFLAPSLNNIICNSEKGDGCIWKEHVRSSIIRTIIECCYPYVVKEKNKIYKDTELGRVIVICPPEEQHDIGARMASDFFTLCGYRSIFVGSNTPKDEFIKVIDFVKPQYLAISVTNYYNLVAVKDIIEKIRNSTNGKLKILIGGSAVVGNSEALKNTNADMIINDFDDIRNLQKENKK